MRPSVINRHHHRDGLPDGSIYIGRGTPLGNPYTVELYGYGALDRYRTWLFERVRAGDRAVLAELGRIGGSAHLVCSCAPRPCHGDIVVEVWEWLAGKGEIE